MWAVGGQVAMLGATFLASPFTIRLLGPARYGLWALLQSVMGYFSLADLGMASTSTRFAAQRHARCDREGEASVVLTALAITVALTSAAAIAASIAAPFLVSEVLHVRGALRSDGVLALRLVSVAAVAYAIANIVNTPQQVRMHWRSLTLATSGPRVLQIAVAPLVLVATAGGLVAMAALLVAACIAAAVLNLVVAVRLQPHLRRPHFASGVAGPLVKYGGPLAVSGLAEVPLLTAERFFLAHFHSTVAVAYYAVAAALGALLAVMPGALAQPLLPALTRLTSEGKIEEHRRLYHQILRGLFLLTTPTALVLAFLAGPFLGLWAGPAYEAHSVAPLYVIVAGLWFNTLAFLPFSQLLASGKTTTIAAVHIVEMLPYLLLAAILTANFGVIGAAAAWSIRVTVDAVAFFVLVRRREGLPWVPTPRRAKTCLLNMASLAVVLWSLSTVTSSLEARAAWSVGTLAAYAVVSGTIVLTSGERRGLKRLLLDIIPRRFAPSPSGSG
jgi:O-antigen/teichoic acid export membrane protein